MSYGRRPEDDNFVTCDPPLKVSLNGKSAEWDFILHTCDIESITDACLACGYRDCPHHEPMHYDKFGCMRCGKIDPMNRPVNNVAQELERWLEGG